MRSDPADELVLMPSLKAHVGSRGGLVLTQKFLNGVAEYAKSWPGRVTALVEISKTYSSDMDHVEVLPDDGKAPLELRPGNAAELRARLAKSAAVLGFLSPYELDTTRLCQDVGVPMILTSEYSPHTEMQIIDAGTRNPLLRWRRKRWVKQAEKKRLEALAIAAGLQCSGTGAFEHYRRFNPNTLLFFDNRVPQNQVLDTRSLDSKLSTLGDRRPLRLAFGGRLIAMKGALELPRVAQALKRNGTPFTLDIYGRGDLEEALRRDITRLGLQDQVKLRGAMDFETGWIPTLKNDVDVFVCCHPQGDPSSTYPEVMSCGVPIVGYDNEAFVGIVRESRSGWLAPMNDAQSVANIITRLDREREEIAVSARAARDFAALHAFELTFAARTKHLIRSSRLPNSIRQQLG